MHWNSLQPMRFHNQLSRKLVSKNSIKAAFVVKVRFQHLDFRKLRNTSTFPFLSPFQCTARNNIIVQAQWVSQNLTLICGEDFSWFKKKGKAIILAYTITEDIKKKVSQQQSGMYVCRLYRHHEQWERGKRLEDLQASAVIQQDSFQTSKRFPSKRTWKANKQFKFSPHLNSSCVLSHHSPTPTTPIPRLSPWKLLWMFSYETFSSKQNRKQSVRLQSCSNQRWFSFSSEC